METNTLKLFSLKRREFRKALKRGRNFREGRLVVKVSKAKERKTKLGILVPKKNVKKAVDRNRIKRRIKEIVRKNFKKIRGNFNLLFIILSGFDPEDRFLKQKIEKLFKKAKIIK
jgi:ribonuclease P protein component